MDNSNDSDNINVHDIDSIVNENFNVQDSSISKSSDSDNNSSHSNENNSKLDDNDDNVISKKGFRKQKRINNWKENKKIKRQLIKEKKIESKQLVDVLDTHELNKKGTDEVNDSIDDNKDVKKISKEDRKQQYLDKCKLNFSVIIDCAWEDNHADRPLVSLCQQIMFCYGFNKKHDNPCEVYVTSMGARMKSQLSKSNYQNWFGMIFTSEDYITLNNFKINNDVDINQQSRKKLVYLTSDSENTISTLDPSCAYIIGGIVDRNKLKGITYKKAKEQGIETAKLPIRENCEMMGTHVLTVNHVFEILLNYSKTNSWKESIEMVIPQRKTSAANTLI